MSSAWARPPARRSDEASARLGVCAGTMGAETVPLPTGDEPFGAVARRVGDRTEPRSHITDEGLDRPGSLHRRRTVRGDRAGRLHPARRRTRLREGGFRRPQRTRRLGGDGRSARRTGRRRRRGRRGVPGRVHLHRTGLTRLSSADHRFDGSSGSPRSSRAVVRNPVCPTIRWSGRTDRGSTCQVRWRISTVRARPNGLRPIA